MRRLFAFVQASKFRTQILLGTLLVLLAVLLVTGSIAYSRISLLIRDSTDRYVRQVALQANDSLDALLGQVDTVTFQIAVDPRLQELLSAIKREAPQGGIDVDHKISAKLVLEELRSYAASIVSIDLYAGDEAVYPVKPAPTERLDPEWSAAADGKPGELVWLGLDPADSGSLLAIRQIRLENDKYASGGYLLVRVGKLGLPIVKPSFPGIEGSIVYWLDGKGEAIASNRAALPLSAGQASAATEPVRIDGTTYVPFRITSRTTNWTLVVLTPLDRLAEGVYVVRDALLWAGLIGTALLVLLTHGLSTMIARPVRKLIRAMRSAPGRVPRPNPAVYYNREMNELNSTYNRMVEQIRELISTVYEKELLQSQAEVKALQAQIHPHFLFNTLEAFYWMLKEKDEDGLAANVIALSELFRYTVKSPGADDWVTVADEVRHAELYMTLMAMRLGDRIGWECDIAPESLKLPLPKLLIQPLIENAIRHGIEPQKGRGVIGLTIRPSADGRSIVIRVEDDGSGIDEEGWERLEADLRGRPSTSPGGGAGIGLSNIRRRLQLYYGTDDAMTIRSRAGQGTVVELNIPKGGSS
ncbi:cache domain-containing sensor histidine kinase [Paenibacillus flagellatus]|nr:sensor histidine kinase [Paenibacillus flagellatus]